ncbi:hypothetical protein GCM10027280_28630 [Micromonospora polyrhachis]
MADAADGAKTTDAVCQDGSLDGRGLARAYYEELVRLLSDAAAVLGRTTQTTSASASRVGLGHA